MIGGSREVVARAEVRNPHNPLRARLQGKEVCFLNKQCHFFEAFALLRDSMSTSHCTTIEQCMSLQAQVRYLTQKVEACKKQLAIHDQRQRDSLQSIVNAERELASMPVRIIDLIFAQVRCLLMFTEADTCFLTS